MSIGLVGKKCGMSRKFTEDGKSIPVTLIEVMPNRVTQVKNIEKDSYSAVQVTTGEKAAHRVNKPAKGHFAKAGSGLGLGLWEFRVAPDSKIADTAIADIVLGTEIKISDVFAVGQKVDVAAKSIGKGFAGTVKRHNFATQDATHGNSLSHRAPGSIGQNQTPGRVFKGKKMAGHLGAVRKTIQGLEIIEINTENNLLAVKGAIPGAPNGHVIIKPSVKAKEVS